MEKATIYDYARMCASFEKCNKCILLKFCAEQRNIFSNDIDKANEIILKWREEHPVKTRQDEFLKMFPNARIVAGTVAVCPKDIETAYACKAVNSNCINCRKSYWLAEVAE